MFKIDVDIGRLLALFGNEAGKEQAVLRGVNRSNPQDEADRRIGRRPAPLTEDAAPLRKGNNVMHGEEVRRIIEPRDDAQLLGDQRPGLGRDAARIALHALDRYQFL